MFALLLATIFVAGFAIGYGLGGLTCYLEQRRKEKEAAEAEKAAALAALEAEQIENDLDK